MLTDKGTAPAARLTPQKVIAGITLTAALLWQLYAVFLAVHEAPRFGPLLSGLGMEPPLITRAFFASYRYWVAIPAGFALLSIDLLRRHEPRIAYFSSVLAGSFGSALILHAWLQQALSAPLADILQKID